MENSTLPLNCSAVKHRALLSESVLEYNSFPSDRTIFLWWINRIHHITKGGLKKNMPSFNLPELRTNGLEVKQKKSESLMKNGGCRAGQCQRVETKRQPCYFSEHNSNSYCQLWILGWGGWVPVHGCQILSSNLLYISVLYNCQRILEIGWLPAQVLQVIVKQFFSASGAIFLSSYSVFLTFCRQFKI